MSEWFTLTDEAFLLLCLELYAAKWNRAWAQAAHQQQQQPEEQKQRDEEDARYTRRSRGTKRSWSRDRLERFNAIIVDVYRDRQANGTAFDQKLDSLLPRTIFTTEVLAKHHNLGTHEESLIV